MCKTKLRYEAWNEVSIDTKFTSLLAFVFKL